MRAADILPVRFNAAAHFVDRNVAEGRGAAPGVPPRRRRPRPHLRRRPRTSPTAPATCPARLGVEPEHRVLVACLDTAEFLGAFWGAMKIGAIPIPVNTLLRTADYRYFLQDSRARVAIVSAPLLTEVGPALDAGTDWLRPRPGRGGPSGRWLSLRGPEPGPGLGGRSPPAETLPDEARLLALLLGLHRLPEGRGPPPPRHGGVHRDVRRAGTRPAGPPIACSRSPSSTSRTAWGTPGTSR